MLAEVFSSLCINLRRPLHSACSASDRLHNQIGCRTINGLELLNPRVVTHRSQVHRLKPPSPIRKVRKPLPYSQFPLPLISNTKRPHLCTGSKDLGIGLKAVWYGAEQFGNIVGLKKKRPQADVRRAPTEVLATHNCMLLFHHPV